jgi:hypothetical protein
LRAMKPSKSLPLPQRGQEFPEGMQEPYAQWAGEGMVHSVLLPPLREKVAGEA